MFLAARPRREGRERSSDRCLIGVCLQKITCSCAGVVLDHKELHGAVSDHCAGWVQPWRSPRGRVAPIHRPPMVGGHVVAPHLRHEKLNAIENSYRRIMR